MMICDYHTIKNTLSLSPSPEHIVRINVHFISLCLIACSLAHSTDKKFKQSGTLVLTTQVDKLVRLGFATFLSLSLPLSIFLSLNVCLFVFWFSIYFTVNLCVFPFSARAMTSLFWLPLFLSLCPNKRLSNSKLN